MFAISQYDLSRKQREPVLRALVHEPPGASHNRVWDAMATSSFRGGVPPVQAKLSVSQPSDPYEQEADRVADQVMRMPEPMVQRKCAACMGGAGPCPQCEGEKNGLVHRKADSAFAASAPSSDAASLISSLGPGRPLDPATRSFFEPRFGSDFRGVRIHDGQSAAESAKSLGARAYALGHNVVFGANQYAPESGEGRNLLAHEFTHVVQQSAAGTPLVIQRSISFDNCSGSEDVITKSHDFTMKMVSDVAAKLKKYDGSNPPEVKKSLDDNMHDSSTELANGLAKKLPWLAEQASDTQYECNPSGKARAWSMFCVPFTDIELHPAWFADKEIAARARTMLHEWLHRYACKFDLAYHHQQDEFAKLSKAQAKTNADSIAWFVYEAR